MINLFQITIIFISLIAFFFFAILRRTRIRDKIYFLLFTLIIVILILHPELTQAVASYVGIGRGVDLVLYLADLLYLYILFLLVVRLKKIESEITTLVREVALMSQLLKRGNND